MRLLKDLTGKKFGKLTALHFVERRNNKSYWKCQCKCGNVKIASINNLHMGKTKSCGCAYTLKKGEAAFNLLYRTYKNNAKNRCSFKLSKTEFKVLTSSNCHYCGEPPSNIKTYKNCNGKYVYNGVDKVNPNKGYIKSNVVSCCWECNRMKGKMSKIKFIEHIKNISYWCG